MQHSKCQAADLLYGPAESYRRYSAHELAEYMSAARGGEGAGVGAYDNEQVALLRHVLEQAHVE